MKFQEELLMTLQNVYYKYVERKEEKYLLEEERSRLIRGTITPVAHYFEDEIGRFLYRILDEKYSVMVDYPILFPGRNNRITPDILIVESNTIVMILELKVDLGYEKENWRVKKEKNIKKINTYKNNLSYKELNEGRKENAKIDIIEDVPYGTIVLSQKNGGKKSEEIINECQSKNCQAGENVPYFHLIKDKKKHPNDFISKNQVDNYFENLVDNYLDEQIRDVVTHDWVRLENYLKRYLDLKHYF